MLRPPDPKRRRLDRPTVNAFGAWAVLSLLLILGTFTSLEQAETTERNAVLDRAEAGANAVEQTMLRKFEAVNRLMDLLQARQAAGSQASMGSSIQREMDAIPGILKIDLVSPDGAATESFIPDAVRLPPLQKPPILPGTFPDEHLLISAPVVDKDTKRWAIQTSRTLTGEQGRVMAIAVVWLDPFKLSDEIGRNNSSDNEASVVQLRGTGEIIARSVNLGLGLTLRVSPRDPVLQHAARLPACEAAAEKLGSRDEQRRAGEACHKFRDRSDGVDRLVGIFAPEDVPIVVSRSFDTDKALADFYNLRSIVITVALALGVGGWFVTRLFVANFLLRERMSEQALRDPLTGLYNRRYFTDVMAARMAHSIRQGESAAVLTIDLDGFKQVNDTRGHPVGDSLLREVGQRLRLCVTGGDTVIRLGGDEFAIVRLGRPQRRDVTALARFIVNEVSETYEVENYHVRISASVGIAMPPEGGEDLNDLLRSADLALYFVKSEGGSGYQMFDPAMEKSHRTRRQLEIDLREALGQDQLEVYYQPLVQIDPYRVSGFEALLRWHHPTMGMVMPSRFIPVAEETGLIAEIGEWVLRQACMQAAQWPGRTRVAVNLSPIQFERSDVVDIVASALRESHLEPERLELEITEGVVMRDSGDVLATLRRLRNLGVRLALDDFGTGYASLSYLRSFPFDKVKIDGSFLADLAGDGGTIIRAVLGLCRHLELDMLVEGVETEEQLAWLRREGCIEAQGHLFSPPRPATGVAEIIGEVAGRAMRRMPEELRVG